MAVWDPIVSIVAFPLLVLSSLLGIRYKPAIYVPEKSMRVAARRRTGNINNVAQDQDQSHTGPNSDVDLDRTEYLTIKTFLETRVPSLFEGYTPTWWMPNGHMQTGFVVAGNFTEVDKVMYERTLLRLPDGGTLGIDVTPLPQDAPNLPDDTPIVVVQHGLTGGSYESYVRSVLAGVCTAKEKGGLGYRGIVSNSRGCAGVPMTSAQNYSGMQTDDLRTALLYIKAKWPRAPLIGLGFSLGANIMTNYLGEEGSRSMLIAAICLACPWDLKMNSDRLEGGFILKHVYSKALGSNIQAKVNEHWPVWRTFPEETNRIIPIAPALLALKNPTLKDMDHHLTRFVGGANPPFPFDSADAYYIAASSHNAVPSIRVPFLAINAADDPIVGFCPSEEVEKLSTSCALVVTRYGGHLGWFENQIAHKSTLFGGPPPDRWIRKPAMEFIRACAEDYIPDEGLLREREAADSAITKREDGFIVMIGKEDRVGYLVAKEGIFVDGSRDKPLKSRLRKGL